MKIVFSRKGFDFSAGGFASPIFPDGRLFSVPIPGSDGAMYSYSDLPVEYEGAPIQEILNDVYGRKIRHGGRRASCDYSSAELKCHYDPMPMSHFGYDGIVFGQANQSESHLRNQTVGSGDIFLFYGWFKQIEKHEGRWRFVTDALDVHVIWSAMRVKEHLCIEAREQREFAYSAYPFIDKHPHMAPRNGHDGCANGIYISKSYRFFDRQDSWVLTDRKKYRGRSTWRMPKCFSHPEAWSYVKEFKNDRDETVTRHQGRGQEFVLNLDKICSVEDRREIIHRVGSLTGFAL